MKRKLAENWKRVEQRIHDACDRANRKPASVTLVVVTKYAPLDVVRALVELGVPNLGESRVQELTKRAASVGDWLDRRAIEPGHATKRRPKWHLVGHLQRNKIKAVLPWVDLIHSVDSLRLAEEIDLHAGKLGRKQPILLEVNALGEPGRFGVAVAAVAHLAEQLGSLPNLELCGLMAMGPNTEDQDAIRALFGRVGEIFSEIVGEKFCGPGFCELSMGMSGDFEHAIEAGATYVRIGSALFEGIELSREAVPAE